MDYLRRLNDALDYIECNLDGYIDYKIAADLACCSVSYFQRMFSFITDVTLSEYIRRRRMTLAAFELQNSDIKIIDLAIKYGYESPDSFSRAFQSLHGLIPSKARNSGISLKAYPRIAFQISIKGDVEMNYRIEKKEAFMILGVKRHYHGPEDNESVVPAFWNELYANGTYEVLYNLSDGTPKGVHGFIQVLDENNVDYTIACVSDKKPQMGTESFVIPESTWAVFEVDGPVQTSMADAWKRIFTEWLPTSNYKYAETIDIECFPYAGDKRAADFKFELWIPVVKM
jgi:AraC family transcriptional regulator